MPIQLTKRGAAGRSLAWLTEEAFTPHRGDGDADGEGLLRWVNIACDMVPKPTPARDVITRFHLPAVDLVRRLQNVVSMPVLFCQSCMYSSITHTRTWIQATNYLLFSFNFWDFQSPPRVNSSCCQISSYQSLVNITVDLYITWSSQSHRWAVGLYEQKQTCMLLDTYSF